MGCGAGLSCATLEGKVEGKDVFLEVQSIYSHSQVPQCSLAVSTS